MVEDKKPDNFYLALCKKGLHSYLIVGHVDNEGNNQVLMRVGKSDIFSSETASLISNTVQPLKILTGAPSMLKDEGLYFGKKFEYKAFDISLPQLLDFYRLVAEIQSKQRNDENLQSIIVKNLEDKAKLCHNFGQFEPKKGELPVFKINEFNEIENEIVNYSQANDVLDSAFKIEAKIPKFNEKGGAPHFFDDSLNSEFYRRLESSWPKSNLGQSVNYGTSELKFDNTCRITALKILETFLGKTHGISARFTKSPGYLTTPLEGNPNPFFILPAPPASVENKDAQRTATLQDIFKRLQKIPDKNPTSEETQEKFNQLKAVYLKMAGDSTLNIGAYLREVEKSSSESLFKKRNPSFLSRLFHLESDTQKLFNQLKKKYSLEKNQITKKEIDISDESSPKLK